MTASPSPVMPCGHHYVHESADGTRCVRCQPTSLGRVAIEYGVYVLTGTVTERHDGWVMVLVDQTCRTIQGLAITGNPYPVPSVCGRYVPFGMSDVTPLVGVTLRKV